MESVAERLRERGRVTGCAAPLISIGAPCRARFRRREIDLARQRQRARMEADKHRRAADRERLKQLGGRLRDASEDDEFAAILARNPGLPRAYFEKQIRDRPAAIST